MQHPHTLKYSSYHSNKRASPPFFHSDNNPVLGYVLVHYVDKPHVLVVAVELIWLLFLNILPFKFFFRLPAVNQPLPKLHCFFALLTLFKAVTFFFFFFKLFLPMMVHLRNPFLLSTPVAQMLLTSRWVSR